MPGPDLGLNLQVEIGPVETGTGQQGVLQLQKVAYILKTHLADEVNFSEFTSFTARPDIFSQKIIKKIASPQV